MKAKKVLSVILSVCMCLSIVAGCTKEGTTSGDSAMGRYVETEIALSEEMDYKNIFQLTKEDNCPVVYQRVVSENEETFSIAKFKYESGEWKNVTEGWLSGVSIVGGYGNLKVMEGAEKYIYYAATDEEENYKAHLLWSEDGTTTMEVTPESWTKMNEEYMFYITPSNVEQLADGRIFIMEYPDVLIYDPQSGSTQPFSAIDNADAYMERASIDGDDIALLKRNDNYNVCGISIFNTKTNISEAEYPYDPTLSGNAILDYKSDTILTLICGDGIFDISQDGTFEKKLDGNLCSLANIDMWAIGMAAMEDDTYFILYETMNDGESIIQYTYDPDMPTAPQTELTIYSLYESYTIQQAAVMYQKEHPDVSVKVEIAIPYEEQETADIDAVLKELSTKLIAGQGADILVLEGLPVDSYIEKNLLLDLSEVVNPMDENGELLSNIVNTYRQEDGSLPAVPTHFGADLLMGKSIDTTQTPDMSTFAQALAEQEEGFLGPMTTTDLVETYAPFFTPDIIQDDTLDKEELKKVFEELKQISGACEMVKEYSETNYKYSSWDLAYKGNVAFDTANGFVESMFSLAIVDFVKGSFTMFDNSYRTIATVGINQATQHEEDAKEFVQLLLSEEMQTCDYYEGFPVNKAAMNTLIDADRTNYMAYTDIQTGEDQYTGFTVGTYDRKIAQSLADMSEGLDKRSYTDSKILTEIEAVFPSYLEGSMSLDEAVDAVEANVRIYLAE